ncbi:hypothetical protein Vadar_023209 [Vaccinium darrowii]|uniref:Uncharacterized protein n=1 Tax=Vaccinium darrowii TaxID=229202 RepID=A0ACB7Z6Q0_9ERIC|nr:hypothetical protein Vadar_023209 [Vaccinium darrowii]
MDVIGKYGELDPMNYQRFTSSASQSTAPLDCDSIREFEQQRVRRIEVETWYAGEREQGWPGELFSLHIEWWNPSPWKLLLMLHMDWVIGNSPVVWVNGNSLVQCTPSLSFRGTSCWSHGIWWRLGCREDGSLWSMDLVTGHGQCTIRNWSTCNNENGNVAVLKPNEAAFEKEIEGRPSTRSIASAVLRAFLINAGLQLIPMVIFHLRGFVINARFCHPVLSICQVFLFR